VFFDGPADRTVLHARIDELERRLALVEEQAHESGPVEAVTQPDEAVAAPDDDRRDDGHLRFGRRTTDRQISMTKVEEADAGHEGARLVALEMLDAGYRPEQVATYLRETFNFDQADAVLAVDGPVSG